MAFVKNTDGKKDDVKMKKIVSVLKKVNAFFNNMADAPVEIAMAVRTDVDHIQDSNLRNLKRHNDFAGIK